VAVELTALTGSLSARQMTHEWLWRVGNIIYFRCEENLSQCHFFFHKFYVSGSALKATETDHLEYSVMYTITFQTVVRVPLLIWYGRLVVCEEM
jgi:hypothetical protein